MKRKHSSKKITLVALSVICCVLVLTEQNIISEASIEKAELPVKIGQEPVQKRPSAFDKKSGSSSEKKATVNGRQTRNVGIEIPIGPKKTPERILKRTAYTLSFNRLTNQPNWVAWCLTDNEIDGVVKRNKDFYEDTDIPEPHRVSPKDYTRSGYDRGHMAPAADMKFSALAMKECFYMSNICPQTHTLNGGGWKKVEEACRRWAEKYGKIYVVCGPVFYDKKHKSIGKEHSVTVPDAFFKCVYGVVKNQPQAIAFIFRNTSAKQKMDEAATSVDEAEKITGMNFFYMLPDEIEEKVESTYNLKDWQ